MSKLIDLVGKRFGKFTVMKRIENDVNGNRRWKCKCDCGKIKNVLGSNLKYNKSRSCGCSHEGNKNSLIHGNTKMGKRSKTYYSWEGMKKRCYNKKSNNYKNYGGRNPSITVCKRWLKFENFLEDMGERPKNKTLDRIDNNGNYCKSNCRWATRKQQCRNTRQNRIILYNGKIQCSIEWAEELGIKPSTLRKRISRGDSAEKALRPIKKGKMK